MDQILPPSHRALVRTYTNSPLSVHTIPAPTVTPGSAIVRMLPAGILSYIGDIYIGVALGTLVEGRPRVRTVQMNGNAVAGMQALAAFGPVVAVLDISSLEVVQTRISSSSPLSSKEYARRSFSNHR